MSALPVQPPSFAPKLEPTPGREPWLRIVKPPQQQRTRTPFVLSCIAVLGGSLLASLLLNTRLAADVYIVHELQSQYAVLLQAEQALTGQVQEASSPLRLAEAAGALGMVPTEFPSFLRLQDGAIIGAAGEP